MSGTLGLTNRQIAMALGDVIGMDVFSIEYGILTFLHEVGHASQKEILFGIGCSSATLQRKLGFLGARGLIDSTTDIEDKRRRIFILTDSTRIILDDELVYFSGWNRERQGNVDGISALVSRLEGKLRIGIFGYKYKILIIIYYSSGINGLALFDESGMSKGNFYSVVNSMKRDGIIYCRNDSEDMRVKSYYLREDVREGVDRAHNSLSDWSSLKFES